MSDVLESLLAMPSCAVLRKPDVDGFLARHPRALIFFTGNVTQRREGLDVAVVVRELASSHRDRLGIGIVDGRDEAVVMVRFGVVVTPAVVYVRDGQTVELVTRMRDWSVYSEACERMFSGENTGDVVTTGGTA